MLTLSAANRAVLSYLRSKWGVVLAFLFVWLLVHVIFFQFTSADLELFLYDWFDYYDQVPLGEALRNPISNYTGPYTYLLFGAKLLQRLVNYQFPAIVMIKLINLPFELITVYLGLMILRYFTDKERLFFYGFALLLFHPIVLINGAFWGQCDIIYSSMLLASFMFLLYKKDLWGVIFFSIALTIKFQAMFFSPLILALVFSKRIKWVWLGIIPAVYLMLHVPSLVAGRPLWDVLTIYLNQAGSVPLLTVNAPNIYQFIPTTSVEWVGVLRIVGLLTAVGAAIWFALRVDKEEMASKPHTFLISAGLVLLFMPFIMPSMLDRYFFPAELFLLLLALVNLRYWPLPILVSSASLLVYYNSYGVIDLGLNALPSKIAAFLNGLALVILLIEFIPLKKKEPDSNQSGSDKPVSG
jgi:Gpi18-like mannosyltransferase